MPASISAEHQKRITEAQASLTRAEAELEKLINALETSERADKKMMGDGLRAAFLTLMNAKAHLSSVLQDSTTLPE